MTEIKTYERTPRYYETDQMGIIHHSNYIRWFEEAREDWMAQMGLDYETIESLGLLIPVLSVSCEYKKPVHYNEIVCIEVSITSFKGLKFSAGYRVIGKESGQLKVIGASSHGFVDRQMKPVRLKKEYPKVYEMFTKAVIPS